MHKTLQNMKHDTILKCENYATKIEYMSIISTILKHENSKHINWETKFIFECEAKFINNLTNNQSKTNF